MNNDLSQKTAFVTGAGGGIGRQIAIEFAKAGAIVGVVDIDQDSAQSVVSEIGSMKGQAKAILLDVTQEHQVNQAIDDFVTEFGALDILVSNAGIQMISPVDKLPYDDWKKMLAIHLDGAFLTTKAALKHMYTNNSGTVIYMGSVHSHEASVLKSPYVTAKHGLLGLCRTLAKEGAKHNVRSHVICPGFVKTPLVEKQIPEQAREKNISEQEVVKNIMLDSNSRWRIYDNRRCGSVGVVFGKFSNQCVYRAILCCQPRLVNEIDI